MQFAKKYIRQKKSITYWKPYLLLKQCLLIISKLMELFLGSCYKLLEKRTNWPDAKSNCESENAAIISIGSSKENDFIKG